MRCGWAKRTSSPIAGPGKVHGPVPPTINGPNRLICLVQSVPNVEPAPPSCCRLATAKPCSSISTRSQPKSPSERTPLSSLIRPAGMAPRPSRFQTTSRSCSFRRAHPNSTARKTSGSSCVRIGCQTGFSNPSTISSITAATLGTHSLTNPGRLCPSRDVTGQQSVTQSEDWYYTPIRPQMGARPASTSNRQSSRRLWQGLLQRSRTPHTHDDHRELHHRLRIELLGRPGWAIPHPSPLERAPEQFHLYREERYSLRQRRRTQTHCCRQYLHHLQKWRTGPPGHRRHISEGFSGRRLLRQRRQQLEWIRFEQLLGEQCRVYRQKMNTCQMILHSWLSP